MNDKSKINQVLIQQLDSLRQRISELEEELHESEEKYRNILENIEDVYFEVDRAGDFTFFNPYSLPYPWLHQRRNAGHELQGINGRRKCKEGLSGF
jgi:PAS domain-containing protein